jgi:hypothetical protein
MGTTFRDTKGQPIEIAAGHASKECDACGRRPPDAFWVGPRTISICYHCALEVMPSLIADAMRARSRDRSWLLRTKDKMLEQFWYAAALALAGETPTRESVAQADQEWQAQFIASVDASTNGKAH